MYTKRELYYLKSIGIDRHPSELSFEELEDLELQLIDRIATSTARNNDKETKESDICKDVLNKLFD